MSFGGGSLSLGERRGWTAPQNVLCRCLPGSYDSDAMVVDSGDTSMSGWSALLSSVTYSSSEGSSAFVLLVTGASGRQILVTGRYRRSLSSGSGGIVRLSPGRGQLMVQVQTARLVASSGAASSLPLHGSVASCASLMLVATRHGLALRAAALSVSSRTSPAPRARCATAERPRRPRPH
jgi:hypothetical protein